MVSLHGGDPVTGNSGPVGQGIVSVAFFAKAHLGRTAPQLSDAIGIRVRYTDLRDFTGSEVDAEDATGHDVTAIEQPTRLHTDCLAGVITGCHGGFENLLTLGIAWTRSTSSPIRTPVCWRRPWPSFPGRRCGPTSSTSA